jgi:DivIVA domain-containing protein
MPLKPEDVVRKTFRSRLRGYDENEVDSFLQEVEDELRRLHVQVDELQAALSRPPTVEAVESQRVAIEREQLELIRTERQELVGELGALQERLDRAQRQVAEADEKVAEANRAEQEAERRRQEAEAAYAELEPKVARAQAVHDDLRTAHDRLVAELRSLRVAAETDAAELFGKTPAEPPADATPADDVAVITAVARRIHDEHVRAGQDEAARVVADAQAEATRVLEQA